MTTAVMSGPVQLSRGPSSTTVTSPTSKANGGGRHKRSSGQSGGSSGLGPVGLKYQEMSPEVTLVEFISASAWFHGVKRQNIKQLEWDILKVFPDNIMPANAAAWYMAKRRFYVDNDYENQLLPFVLKNYPKKFLVKGQTVEFLETYTKEVARKKMYQMLGQGLLAYFTHKVEEYGVYFFDPFYYETTEPFHANLRAVTNSYTAHRSKLLPNFFELHKKQFVYQQHSPYLVTISGFPVEVKTNTVGIIVSMVDNQCGILQFPNGHTTEKAFFSAKSLFRDGWLYQGDPMKLPAMEFDGYRVPANSAPHGGKHGDFQWYAVLVWCGRKPSPKYCSTKEDLTSSPYFQSNNNTVSGGVISGTTLNGVMGYEDMMAKPKFSDENTRGGKKGNNKGYKQLDHAKGGCMQVGEVLSIRKNGAVVSLGKDSEEKAFIPGWFHKNVKYAGNFLTTTQGVELTLKDLITFCLDPAASPVKGYSGVGCNVTVLKHAADDGKAANSASLLQPNDTSSPKKKSGRKNAKKSVTSESSETAKEDVGKGKKKSKKGRKDSAAAEDSADGNKPTRTKKKSESKPPRVNYLEFLLHSEVAEEDAAEEENDPDFAIADIDSDEYSDQDIDEEEMKALIEESAEKDDTIEELRKELEKFQLEEEEKKKAEDEAAAAEKAKDAGASSESKDSSSDKNEDDRKADSSDVEVVEVKKVSEDVVDPAVAKEGKHGKPRLLLFGSAGAGKHSLALQWANAAVDPAAGDAKKVELEDLKKAKRITLKVASDDKANKVEVVFVKEGAEKVPVGDNVVVVVDLTDVESLTKAAAWIKDWNKDKDTGKKNAVRILVGNKSDAKDGRKVTKESAEKVASEAGFVYQELSAEKRDEAVAVWKDVVQKMAVAPTAADAGEEAKKADA